MPPLLETLDDVLFDEEGEGSASTSLFVRWCQQLTQWDEVAKEIAHKKQKGEEKKEGEDEGDREEAKDLLLHPHTSCKPLELLPLPQNFAELIMVRDTFATIA